MALWTNVQLTAYKSVTKSDVSEEQRDTDNVKLFMRSDLKFANTLHLQTGVTIPFIM